MSGGWMRRIRIARRAVQGIAGAAILAGACARSSSSVPAGPMPAMPASMPSDTTPVGTPEQRFVDSEIVRRDSRF